jgi:hypothetical protein
MRLKSSQGLASVVDGLVDRLVVVLDDVQAVWGGGLGNALDKVLESNRISRMSSKVSHVRGVAK